MASGLSALAENLNPYNGQEINNINELRKIYNTSEHFKDDEQF